MEKISKTNLEKIAAHVIEVQERQEAEYRCNNCGAAYDLEDNYCGKCGNRLKPISLEDHK